MIVYSTEPRVILTKEAALDAAREGIIRKYPHVDADTIKVSASFCPATEVWTGYAEGVVSGVASNTTPVVVSSSVFEDTAADFENDYYLYEEIVVGCKREAIKRLQEIGKSFTKVTFQTHDETAGDIRRIWVTAIGII